MISPQWSQRPYVAVDYCWAFILNGSALPLMRERNYLKEPVAILWIVIGLVLSVAVMIGIVSLVPRY